MWQPFYSAKEQVCEWELSSSCAYQVILATAIRKQRLGSCNRVSAVRYATGEWFTEQRGIGRVDPDAVQQQLRPRQSVRRFVARACQHQQIHYSVVSAASKLR